MQDFTKDKVPSCPHSNVLKSCCPHAKDEQTGAQGGGRTLEGTTSNSRNIQEFNPRLQLSLDASVVPLRKSRAGAGAL